MLLSLGSTMQVSPTSSGARVQQCVDTSGSSGPLFSEKYCAASATENLPVNHGGTTGEIGRDASTSTLEDCRSLCTSTNACTHYSYTQSSTDCLLYASCPAGKQYGNGEAGTITYALTSSTGHLLIRTVWPGDPDFGAVLTL